MTSTTSAFIPAASRAGTAAYSPDTAASPASGESSETRTFEELCSEQDTAGDTGFASSAQEAEEVRVSQTDDDASVCHGDEPTDEIADEDDENETPAEAVPTLESPSIIQTLLASLRGVTPIVTPAENAAPSASASTTATSVRAEGRQTTPTQAESPADGVVGTRRHGRARASADGQTAESTSDRRQPSAAASARAADKDAAVAASPVSLAARTKAQPAEEAPAQPAIARLVQARGQAEKSAAQAGIAQAIQNSAGQNKFLLTDDQSVATSPRSAGTRTAIPASTMSSSTTTAQRHAESPVLATASSTTAGQGTWAETLSVDWKGWTNGGGERSSTAAQFSQLGDKLNQHGVAATPGAPAIARAATPVAQAAAPVAPTVPADAAEALAPIHSAIERLVLHGRDQLALTVRFEQGGSLSIKLAMNQGEIATQIQTDVPGLEAALKSAWGDLAQDWNSRGWKLSQPEFTASAATYHSRDDSATADSRDARHQARQEGDEAPDFGGRAFSPARLKHAGAVALSGLDALRAAALARRGIHTWA